MNFFIYTNLFHSLDSANINCLNRGDQYSGVHDKLLFKKNITSTRKLNVRRNLNRLIPSNETHIFCKQNVSYLIKDLCILKPEENYTPCLLETGGILDL